MKSLEEHRAQITIEFSNFILYRTSDQMRSLIQLLDALIEDGQAQLIDIKPEALLKAQGKIQQMVNLRGAIMDPDRFALIRV